MPNCNGTSGRARRVADLRNRGGSSRAATVWYTWYCGIPYRNVGPSCAFFWSSAPDGEGWRTSRVRAPHAVIVHQAADWLAIGAQVVGLAGRIPAGRDAERQPQQRGQQHVGKLNHQHEDGGGDRQRQPEIAQQVGSGRISTDSSATTPSARPTSLPGVNGRSFESIPVMVAASAMAQDTMAGAGAVPAAGCVTARPWAA